MHILIEIPDETYNSFMGEWSKTMEILDAVRHGSVLSEIWNYDFENAPADTPIHLLSKNPTMEFVGTITKNGGDLFRGKCIQGDADIFYRSAIVAWKW